MVRIVGQFLGAGLNYVRKARGLALAYKGPHQGSMYRILSRGGGLFVASLLEKV